MWGGVAVAAVTIGYKMYALFTRENEVVGFAQQQQDGDNLEVIDPQSERAEQYQQAYNNGINNQLLDPESSLDNLDLVSYYSDRPSTFISVPNADAWAEKTATQKKSFAMTKVTQVLKRDHGMSVELAAEKAYKLVHKNIDL